MSHPDALPDLFLDRSLGRIRVPELLRAAGLRLTTLAEHYGVPEDERVARILVIRGGGRLRTKSEHDAGEPNQEEHVAYQFR